MADWQLLHSSVDIAGTWRNVTGTPVVSAEVVAGGARNFGSSLAGVYRFTVVYVEDPLWSFCVSCSIMSPLDISNPLVFSTPRTIVADGVSSNWNVLPGWAVVLASDLQDGDVFEIGVGCSWDSGSGSWVRAVSLGTRIAGRISGTITLTAKNISGGTLTDCIVVATNAIRVENLPGYTYTGSQYAWNVRPFFAAWQQGLSNPDADDDLAGSALTITYRYGGGILGVRRITIESDDAPIDAYDVTNSLPRPGKDNPTSGYGQNLLCDEATVYKFPDGSKFQGLHFILGEYCDTWDAATLYVSDGGDAVQLATASGSFVAGPAGVVLTETGQATGTITDDGEVEFRLRVNPLVSDLADLNERSFSLRLIGTNIADAEVALELQGSLSLVETEGLINFRANVGAEAYPLPHYTRTIDGETVTYTEDEDGHYVENPAAPDTYILVSIDGLTRYSEDPENPGTYIEDPEGGYVEDPENPGYYVPATEHPTGGYYPSYAGTGGALAANGVYLSGGA